MESVNKKCSNSFSAKRLLHLATRRRRFTRRNASVRKLFNYFCLSFDCDFFFNFYLQTKIRIKNRFENLKKTAQSCQVQFKKDRLFSLMNIIKFCELDEVKIKFVLNYFLQSCISKLKNIFFCLSRI
jgi:hypothetical protein